MLLIHSVKKVDPAAEDSSVALIKFITKAIKQTGISSSKITDIINQDSRSSTP